MKGLTVTKNVFDKYYTKPEVAKQMLDVLYKYTNSDDTYIEPSAGNGSFYNQMVGKKIGYDLVPECEGVITSDYLKVDIPDNCVVVGNPPFGKRNKLTKEFIKNSLNSRIIAFILPKSFEKETTQKVFPKNWALVENVELPLNSFTNFGADYSIPCVFQIWIKDYLGMNKRESLKPHTSTNAFKRVSKEQASHFIFGASPRKVIYPDQVNSNNRGYYIKFTTTEDYNKFLKVPWDIYRKGSASGGVSWFTYKEIEKAYVDHYKENDYG